MKKIYVLLVAIGFVTMSFSSLSELTDAERKVAVENLTKSRDALMKKVKGLSDAQLNFKASEDSWSIAECVEHIAISENNLFGLVQMSLKEAADPSRRSEVKMSDDQILGLITDRSTKVKTNERFVPSNSFGSYAGTLKEFKTKRNQTIEFIKTTKEDLRNHYFTFPFGTTDTYQTVLFLSGHTQRHTEQIEEVMADANFPKK